jgi:hypothetical protein
VPRPMCSVPWSCGYLPTLMKAKKQWIPTAAT